MINEQNRIELINLELKSIFGSFVFDYRMIRLITAEEKKKKKVNRERNLLTIAQ